jgi:hypothetical protein
MSHAHHHNAGTLQLAWQRATTSLNLLAIGGSFVACAAWVAADAHHYPNTGWWEFPLAWLMIGFMSSLPFLLTLSFLREGDAEWQRTLTITANLAYAVIGLASLYRHLAGGRSDAMEVASMWLAPVALLGAVYLVFHQD